MQAADESDSVVIQTGCSTLSSISKAYLYSTRLTADAVFKSAEERSELSAAVRLTLSHSRPVCVLFGILVVLLHFYCIRVAVS